MDQKMFCYQCEQTAGCAGCTGSTGVCGKTAETARLQDQLVGAMIGLARAAEGVECPGDRVYRTVIEGLFTTLTNVSFDDDAIRAQIEKTHREKERLLAAPVKKSAGPREKAAGESGAAASVQDTDDYNLGLLWDMDPDIRSLKSLILFGLKGMAAYAYHALMLGASDETVNRTPGDRKRRHRRKPAPDGPEGRRGEPHLYGDAGRSKHGNLRDSDPGQRTACGRKRTVYRCDGT